MNPAQLLMMIKRNNQQIEKRQIFNILLPMSLARKLINNFIKTISITLRASIQFTSPLYSPERLPSPMSLLLSQLSIALMISLIKSQFHSPYDDAAKTTEFTNSFLSVIVN